MNETSVTTPNELEIRVERIFDAPRTHVFSPDWSGADPWWWAWHRRQGWTSVPAAPRFRTAYGVVEGEFREVVPPARL
jgi:hypothetical protein